MADPLSIAASIAGLISITVEAAKFLSPYVSAAKETPQVAAHVFSEIQSTQVILQGLQSLTTNFASVKAQYAALIGVNQVVTILTDGVLLFSELQSELKSLPAKDEREEKIPIWARLQWARKEGSLNTLILRLQSFKSSMTLVLMILKSDSDRSAAEHQEQLANNVKVLLETNHSLSHRLMSLEDALEAQTIVTQRRSILSLSGRLSSQLQEQEPAPPNPPKSPLSINTNSGLPKSDFEDDLESSRVYRRAQRDTMDFSYRSSITRSNAWSVFSGLSLGDISLISVIGLPVFPHDITNAHHYHFGQATSMKWKPRDSDCVKDTPMPRDIPRVVQGHPLLVKCDILKAKMLQIPGMKMFFDQVISPTDSFHHLWEVLGQASPLVILVRALNPQIDVPLQRWNNSSPDPKDHLSPKSKKIITGDHYGFLKVLSTLSLVIEKLRAESIVNYWSHLDLDLAEESIGPFVAPLPCSESLIKVAFDQQSFAQKMEELVQIKTRLTGDLVWGENEDINGTFGRVRQLADIHIDLLIRMERNLFIIESERRWASVFGFWLQNIETETVFIMNELSIKAEIRSLISSRRGTDKDPTKTLLTKCLTILPLITDRASVYTHFLHTILPMSADQREDITYALSHVRKASIKINEAITFREDSESHGNTGVMRLQSVNSWRKGLSPDEDGEVVSDLDERMWNWKGLRPSDFGDLIIHTLLS
ncbi:uncharacterized protein FIESC28_01873 [Fusarium coffeatum]|uniref:Azaphilone pigments biosynthesis cluster protein L N-terminal domain-containing protein n=1 Tax=Fusarium coffeatum TaxID=231269 RepID=A0A366S7G5_9HYPO|nr:uncharacterized protein FIESC28_01873 [Fusarium coffeatum]RBR25264.1 hypothetical protein FIESC28_01873 [Fusarium coffeatum]